MKLLTANDLMTDELRAELPALYATENDPEKLVRVKYFDPCSNWTWFAVEFDGKDTFFGLVVGHETELGYFSLSELQSVRNRRGLGIERDLYFTPVPLCTLMKKRRE